MVNDKDYRIVINEELKSFENIKGFSEWSLVYEIQKGWSGDRKYFIKGNLGEEMLLRVSDISNYESKKKEFQLLSTLAELDINMSRPLQFGVCDKGTKVYSLLTYIQGDDAEAILPTLTEKQQYNLGIEAGRILSKIHSLKAPEGIENWSDRFNKKIDRKIRMYEDCEIKIPNGDKIVEYLNKNRHLLNNRNQSVHHGDYHVGNLIVTKDMKIGVIDFNRYDYGDPWEEFNRISFSLRVSIPFTNGQIHGYFNGEPPMEFFKLLALYLGSNSLSSVPWAVSFGKDEIDFMLMMVNKMMEDYNNFESVIPSWYESLEQ